jgi:hypothetical protein
VVRGQGRGEGWTALGPERAEVYYGEEVRKGACAEDEMMDITSG